MQSIRERYDEALDYIKNVEPGCPLQPDIYDSSNSKLCEAKYKKLNVLKGTVNIKGTGTGSQSVDLNLKGKAINIQPDGTEYAVEKRDETATVRVYEGQVTITSEGEPPLALAAGRQMTLPDGKISALAPASAPRTGGIPLADLDLHSDTPEPYGVSELRAEDGSLPAGWTWQEPNRDLNGPGDATLAVVDADTLRITVPNENEQWSNRADVPRLLHKVTGDFDLEAEMLLESKGTHMTFSEFVLFTPDAPLGRLQGQMSTGGLGDNYFVAGGGWSHWQNKNGLAVVNREMRDYADAPDGPLRVRLARRGDQFKAYWSKDEGQTWTLAARHVLSLPETVWAGWLFKRVAADGLPNEPAVTTLRDIRLTSAEPGALPYAEWDVVGHRGQVVSQNSALVMEQDGTEGKYLEAYSPWSITGDVDLIVRYEAAPVPGQPGLDRYIHVGLSSNDEKQQVWVRNAIMPDGSQRYDANMGRDYHWKNTQENAGRVRLVRNAGAFSAYYWQDGDWTKLAGWQPGFNDPVYLDFRFLWKSPTPALQGVVFTIERLETEIGLLIGADDSAAVAPVASATPTATTTAAPQPKPAATPKPKPTAAPKVQACAVTVDAQIAPEWDRKQLGCAVAPAVRTFAAVQAFDHGLMIWRKDQTVIYTVPDGVRWELWPDLWTVGGPLPGRGDPPSGSQAPVQGFGLIWGREDAVYRNLGWARGAESGMCAVIQKFEKGAVILRSKTDLCDGEASSKESAWFFGVHLFGNGSWQ